MANIYEQKAMDDLKGAAPEFEKLTQAFLFGDIWKRPGLSHRDNGLTKEELVAAITHIAFYAGWPPAVSGFAHLKKVIDQQ